MAAGLARAHRVDPGPRLVERERQRVDVAGRRDPAALGLLGRHVGQRAHHVAGGGQALAARQVGDAEVGELGEARARRGLGQHHHVAGLHVAVDHPARVGVLERVAQRGADARHVAVGHRALAGQLLERGAVHQLGHQVDVVVVRAHLVERDDARVVQPRGRERLALDARALDRRRRSRGTTFTATSRSSFSSWARQTTPKPPAPRRRSRR